MTDRCECGAKADVIEGMRPMCAKHALEKAQRDEKQKRVTRFAA